MHFACGRLNAVIHREIRILTSGGGTEFHPTERAALPGAVLPDDRALVVRIERPTDAGLLPDHNEIAPTGARQHRRVSEIEVWPDIVADGAVRRIGLIAADHEHVFRRYLRRPENLAVVH